VIHEWQDALAEVISLLGRHLGGYLVSGHIVSCRFLRGHRLRRRYRTLPRCRNRKSIDALGEAREAASIFEEDTFGYETKVDDDGRHADDANGEAMEEFERKDSCHTDDEPLACMGRLASGLLEFEAEPPFGEKHASVAALKWN
jgi:hypothetical protein